MTLTVFRSIETPNFDKTWGIGTDDFDMGKKWGNRLNQSKVNFSTIATELGCFGIINPNKICFSNKDSCLTIFQENIGNDFNPNIIPMWCKRLS